MKIITSNEKEYAAEWADTVSAGELYLQMQDARPLSVIAAEFENLAWLKREDENQGNKTYTDYGNLKAIQRTARGAVRIVLDKGVDAV